MTLLILATPQPAQARASSRGCSGRGAVEALPDGVELAPETGETFAENALAKARAGRRGDRARGDRRRLGDRRGRARRRARRALGALRRRARDRRGEPRAADRARAGRQRAGLRLRDRLRRSGAAASSGVFEGRCEGRWPRRRAASGGFGYDPVFVPDERRRAHDGRARAPPRRTRSATAASRCGRSRRGTAARTRRRGSEQVDRRGDADRERPRPGSRGSARAAARGR